MSSQANNPTREVAQENYADQSVAGEEDPGAASDTMPPCSGRPGATDTVGAHDDVFAFCGSPSAPESGDANGSKQLRKALLRWVNEGGADSDLVTAQAAPEQGRTQVDLTNAELVQLQVRVIALENLVTALLAGASCETTDLARALAAYISPRPGATPHHLTIRAAAQMVHLVERAKLFPPYSGNAPS
jgi:hypothetical protein